MTHNLSISMADYLRVVLPHIPASLVTFEALSSIQSLARNLPPFSIGGFECRLGEGQSRVDFQVRSSRMTFNLPEDSATHPLWQTFMSFRQDWLDPKTQICQIIDNVWLEFDLIRKPSSLPIPSIFFSLNQLNFDNYMLREIAIESLLKLLNSSTYLLIKSKIQASIDSLPNDARIAHIGAMILRPTKVLRVVVKGIPPQKLSEYLEDIGWQDSTNKLSTLLSDLSNFVNSISLAFDVGDRIYPKIGLECFLDRQPFIDKLGWQSFLEDYLIKEGLCSSDKANALLAWPGFSQRADQPDLWPSNLNRLDFLFSEKALSLFYRTINHIKITYEPSSCLKAKAYLAFFHSYLELPL